MNPSIHHDSYALKGSGVIDIYSTEQVTTNIDLEIAPEMPLQVSGHVLDRFTQGKGIESAAVSVFTEANKFAGKTYTDGEGYFVFTTLAGGRYQLTASKEGYRTASFAAFTLEPGIPVALNVVLPPLESCENLVYGRVTASGVPLEGASVSILRPDGGTEAATVTAPDGAYAVYGLADGSYTTSICAQGYTSRRTDFAVSPQSRIQNIDAALAPINCAESAAVVSGFITDRAGHALAGAWVGLYEVCPDGREAMIATDLTTTEGFYCFSSVPAGRYTVKAKAMVM